MSVAIVSSNRLLGWAFFHMGHAMARRSWFFEDSVLLASGKSMWQPCLTTSVLVPGRASFCESISGSSCTFKGFRDGEILLANHLGFSTRIMGSKLRPRFWAQNGFPAHCRWEWDEGVTFQVGEHRCIPKLVERKVCAAQRTRYRWPFVGRRRQ